MTDYMLQVKGLKTYYYTEEGVVPAVDGLDFEVAQGETFAIVGESGCGKSVTSLSILGLIPNPPGKIIAGEILYNGEDLLKKTEKQMRAIRGNEISMIFQEPMTSLNPVFTVGRQISESFKYHQHLGKKEARDRAIEMLRLVGIPSPDKVVDDYPHQLSGGMRQRVMIAMALACNPRVLIADEPTTALDVTIQAQIMRLLKQLKEKMGTSIILITHDLGVVAQIAQRVMVMYCGEAVECCAAREIYKNPPAPLYVGPAGLGAEADRRRHGGTPGHSGHGALPERIAEGLPVRAALRKVRPPLPAGKAGAGGARGRAQGPLFSL